MAEGQDKAARSLLDLESSAIIDLFIIYPDIINEPSTYVPVHNGAVFRKGVVWQGLTYIPVSMEIEGFEINADGRINRPKIKISNKDYFVTTMLKKYNDFKNARISRKRTLVKFLDDVNFEGGNPFGGADSSAEISEQQYIVSQKTIENKVFVEFELTSPLDLDTFEVNNRRILGKYCYWKYRGDGCQYDGPPIQKEDGSPFKDIYENQIPITGLSDALEYQDSKEYTTGDVVFTRNNRVVISDPNGSREPLPLLNYFVAKTNVRGLNPEKHPDYWDRDGCNKKLSSCKLRFTSQRTITRFVGTEEVEKLVSRIASYQGTNPVTSYYEPEKQLPFLQTLSGNQGWTMLFNFTMNPRLYSKGQTFYLHTNPNVYEGLELSHYERTDTDYWYYRDQGGTNRYLGLYPTDSPLVDGYNGYRFAARCSVDGAELSHYNPTNKTKTNAYNNFQGDVQIYNHFRVLGAIRNLNWNTSYTQNGAFNSTLEGLCVWDRYLSDEEIQTLYRKLNNGALALRPYSEIAAGETPIENGLLNGLLAWWDTPFEIEGKTGITDKSINKNDLILNGGNNYGLPVRTLHKYTYSLNENVTNQEELAYLPFGGFPGTDGFGFQR